MLVPAGQSQTANVDSVLMTREALDRMLDEREQLVREKLAADVALAAAHVVIETRDEQYAALSKLENRKTKENWLWRVGAGVLAGLAIILQQNQTQ